MERHVFDPNQPQGAMSLMNLRNALRALFQGDLMPLRPRASYILDDMEYAADAEAATAFSGTGLTVTKSTTKEEGNYALQAVVDATPNRDLSSILKALNLSAYKTITLWHRVNGVSQTFRFYVKDHSGNVSYWNLTSHGTTDTWKQDTITLATPSGNSGTAADLTDIHYFGYYNLPASKTFLFDTIAAQVGLTVAVEPALVANYYAQIYIGSAHLSFAGGSAPAITPPSANPRIDLLAINNAGVLSWTIGTEASTPVEPTYPSGKIPICLVYQKTTMTKVVNFEDKDANTNEGYIYRDVRPLMLLGMSAFLALTDCPASYSGQAGKVPVVNTGETALEFQAKDAYYAD